MNPWFFYNSTSPQQTYIPNELGMAVSVYNDTDTNISIVFRDFTEEFLPREKKYYLRDIDDPIFFSVYPSETVYNIARYVNNVVIKQTDQNFQPTFFFSTRKFVG
jgi:hypothetical protein